MDTNTPQKLSLEHLCTLADTPRRTVRYYIQQGLLAKPHGEKRGAWYDQTHVDQLLKIRTWQADGLSLGRISELLAGPPADALPARRPGTVEVWSRVFINDGLELSIEPSRAGLTPEQLKELVSEVAAIHQRLSSGAGSAKENKE